MKKNKVIASALACATTFALFAASDRIDITLGGKLASIMVDDIKELTVGKTAGQEGYTTLHITTPTGVATHSIDDLGEMTYTPLDESLYHEIVRNNDDEHAKIRLLDSRNNSDIGPAQIDPTKPADYRAARIVDNPHYLVDTDKGFTSEVFITGIYTGKVYSDNPNFIFWSLGENNLLGLDSYSFDMPFEPVEIKAVSEELDTYAGAPFLGAYKGYKLFPGEARVANNATPTLSVEIKANETYVIKSTDENEYDILDLYKWDQEKNTISYIPYEGPQRNPMSIDIWYGLTGKLNGDGILFATMHNIVEDRPEYNVPYFVTSKDAKVSVAVGDEYNRFALVQYTETGKASRFFYYGESSTNPEEVTMNFSSGNNIGTACSAFCLKDGEKLFKYDHNGTDAPVYTFRGREYGEYTSTESSSKLTLDGFGGLTMGTQTGTYTIEGGVLTVKFTDDSNSYFYVIDLSARTYSTMVSDPWDGKMEYLLETATGAYAGGDLTTNNRIRVALDQYPNGNPAEGYATIAFSFGRKDGFSGTLGGVSDCGKYIYNAETNTLTITNVWVGVSATAYGKRNVTFVLSDDKKTMWLDDSKEDRLYNMEKNGSYILTGKVNTLTTTSTDPDPAAVDLYAKYTGKAAVTQQGMSLVMDCDVTINFDNEGGTASLLITDGSIDYVKAVNTEFFMTGYTVYIKNVSVYELNGSTYEQVTKDLVFTASEDGTVLTSTEKIAYSTPYFTRFVDLSDKEFKSSSAVVGPDPGTSVELADSYSGTIPFYMFQNVNFNSSTFTFDKANKQVTVALKHSSMGNVDFTVPYTIEGTVLTFVGVKDYTNYSNPTDVDIKFNISEDGKTITGIDGEKSMWLTAMFQQLDIRWGSAQMTAQ